MNRQQPEQKKEGETQKWWKARRNKTPALVQLISSYVIWLRNVCLQVRTPPVRKKAFLKRFTALCYIKYLAFASHLPLLAIRGGREIRKCVGLTGQKRMEPKKNECKKEKNNGWAHKKKKKTRKGQVGTDLKSRG